MHVHQCVCGGCRLCGGHDLASPVKGHYCLACRYLRPVPGSATAPNSMVMVAKVMIQSAILAAGNKARTGEDAVDRVVTGEAFVLGIGGAVWRWAAAMSALLWLRWAIYSSVLTLVWCDMAHLDRACSVIPLVIYIIVIYHCHISIY